MYINCQIPNFYLASFSASSYGIFIVINIHGIIFQYWSFYYSHTRSIFRLFFSISWFSVSMRRVCLFLSVSPFAWGSARWRHLRHGTWNPSIGRPPPPFLLFPFAAIFLHCEPSVTFHSTLLFPKFQSINTFPRLPTIHLSLLDLLRPSVTFPWVFFTFNFPKSELSKKLTQTRLFHGPPSWAHISMYILKIYFNYILAYNPCIFSYAVYISHVYRI